MTSPKLAPPKPRLSGAPIRLRLANWEIAKAVDTLAVDQVLRYVREDSPRPQWFYRRAELNGITVCCHCVGAALVVVRVK